jgi:hypothetical protein
MFRKLIVLASFVLLLGVVSNAEDIQWVGGGADNLWSTPENWDLGRVPTLDDEVRIDVPAAAAPNGPVIQDGIDAKAKGVFTEAAGEPTLAITGGTLEVAEWIWWGDGADSFAILDMSGGTVSVTDEFELGWGGGAGTLTITGGTINAGEAVVPTGSGAFGLLYLNGGTYNVTKPGGLEVNATGMVDITGGTLVLEGDETAKVNDLVAAGQITAYGGAGQINVDFDLSNPGKTTVTATIEKTVLFAEDFEGLTLGPNVDEALAGDAVWTDTPPEGWTVDDSGIPGIGLDATDGITEWAGWAFVDKAWWIEAAEDQDRSLFELGIGIVAVADPDEWDDGERLPLPIDANPYDTWLTTPEIKISKVEAGTLELKFDSSWRPEFDDNYHQTASITASFDGGEPVTVLLWESDEASPNYHPYATNETVIVNLGNPEGAKKVVLTFGLFDAGNDWWWAIDNIELRGYVPYLEPVDPGTNGLLAYYALDGDANDSSGNGNDGTINNADTGGLGDGGSVWVDDPEHGMVISFNGDNSSGAYIDTPLIIPAMTMDNSFSWSFWAKQENDGTGVNEVIVGNRYAADGSDPLEFIKFTPTKFEYYNNDPDYAVTIDYDDIPGGVWIHHAGVKNGTTLTYYRNGVEAGTSTITYTIQEIPFFMGGITSGERWSGYLSKVGIYERALSEAEVRYLAGERAADPSLVIYYSFDEVSDIVADQSDKGNDGIVVGDVTAEANGMYGGAANLANTGYLDLDGANFPSEDIPTSGFTLAAWTNIDGTSNQNAIFNARASDSTWLIHPEIRPGDGDYRFTVRKYGGVTIGNINGGTPGYKKPEGTPVPNEWVHVAMTFSRADAQVTLYVNGDVIAQAPISEDADMAGDWGLGARVGYNIDDARHYTGLMDEFRMYTRALSQDEILDMMAGL